MEKWPFKFKLTREERALEREIHRYVPVPKAKYEEIAQALARRKKEAVLHIRMNRHDLDSLKKKAKRFGIGYQTFIAEILHHFAI
jgi:predicted DNA binding CopG/RHH family protein